MSFDWIEINVGDIIRKSHIIELRENIDSIKDNLACITDKSDYKSGYDTSVDSGYKSGYKSGYNSSVLNDNHGTYDSNEHGTYKSGHHSGYDNPHDGTIYVYECSTVYGQAEANVVS